MEPEFSPLTLNPELDNFFAISLDLLCIARFDGYFERLSPGWEDVLGYSLEELMQIKFMSLVHPEDLKRTQDRIRRLTEGQAVENGFSNRYLHKNGYYVTLEWSSRTHRGRIFSSARDITGRLEIEQQLKEQHERYTKALEGSNTGVWDIDIFGDAISVSPRWWAIMGEMSQQPGLISHHTFFNRIHPEDLPRIMEFSRGVLRQSDHAFEVEFRMRHQNGSYVWVLSRGTILVNALGVPYRIVGANTDITEKKQWEEALQSKNLVLEMAGQMARLGYFETILEPETYFWSPGTYEIFEVDETYPLSHSHIEEFYVAGLHREKARELGKKLVEQNEPFDSEFLIRTGKGREIWIRVWAKAEFRNGSCYRILGTIQDINEEKKKRLEELEKEKLLRMLSGSNAGGWEWQIETGKSFCNERWCEILGYAREEINPMSLDKWLSLVHPDDHGVLHQNWEKVLAGQDRFQTEVRARHKKGHYLWIQDNGKVIFDPKTGQPSQVYGAILDISERKTTELNLKLFQNLMDNATDAIQVARESGQLLYLNLVASQRLGIDPEETSSYRVQDFETRLQDENAWQKHLQELKTEEPLIFQGENRNLKTGKTIPVEVHVKYLKIENEGYIIAASRDVSERREAEEKIQYELRFQKALLDISFTFINIGLDQVDNAINKSLQTLGEFAGADRAYLFDYDLGKNTFSNTHEWCGPGISPQIHALQDFPMDQMPLFVEKHKRGESVILNLSDDITNEESRVTHEIMVAQEIQNLITTPLVFQSELIGFVGFDSVKTVRPFSEKAENLLTLFSELLVNVRRRKQREKTLFYQEKKYRSILNNSNLGILEIDPHGIITFCNPVFENLSQLPREKLLGQHAGTLLFGEGNEEILEGHIERRRQGIRDSYEMTFTRPDGQPRFWFTSGAPNYDESGTFCGAVKVFLDLTEKKKLEQEQMVLAELTQNQNHRLRNFAYIVSHNLRSHAGNIRSLVALQSENTQSVDLEVLGMLNSAAQNLMETIENLSEVAQLTTFDQKGMEFLNLSEFVEKAISHVSALALGNQVEIQNEMPGLEVVQGVPAYVESIILNLLTNAIKYRNPEQATCRVCIRSRKKGNRVLLEIEDNGLGINLQRHRSKLFGMYKTFHRHPDSKGLGLFITRNQIEAMGGSIEVQSQEGVGSTFTLIFQHGKN